MAQRLRRLLADKAPQGAEFTLKSLIDQVHPRSAEELAAALGDLVRKGQLRQIIRVYSRRVPGGGIRDFNSLKEIPPVIHDWRSDTQMEVDPEDYKVVYVLPAHT